MTNEELIRAVQADGYNYIAVAQRILSDGVQSGDRTGTGTLRLWGGMLQFDLSDRFPLLTSKRVFWKGVVEELLWFLRGETNAKSLQEKGVRIWDEWATNDGELGPVYGAMWRHWPSQRQMIDIDQIAYVVEELKRDPDTRRAVVSSWNPDLLPRTDLAPHVNAAMGLQALPPCHTLFQFGALPNGDGTYTLNLNLYQRSADWFLGVPFNIASYSLLLLIVSKLTGMRPGAFFHYFGDVHLYSNHVDAMNEQIANHYRDPRPFPTVRLSDNQDWRLQVVNKWRLEDFIIEDYDPHPVIKAPISI